MPNVALIELCWKRRVLYITEYMNGIASEMHFSSHCDPLTKRFTVCSMFIPPINPSCRMVSWKKTGSVSQSNHRITFRIFQICTHNCYNEHVGSGVKWLSNQNLWVGLLRPWEASFGLEVLLRSTPCHNLKIPEEIHIVEVRSQMLQVRCCRELSFVFPGQQIPEVKLHNCSHFQCVCVCVPFDFVFPSYQAQQIHWSGWSGSIIIIHSPSNFGHLGVISP